MNSADNSHKSTESRARAFDQTQNALNTNKHLESAARPPPRRIRMTSNVYGLPLFKDTYISASRQTDKRSVKH